MPERVYLSPSERRDLTRLVATEVDHRLARRNPDVYRQQVQGVVDTVMNRLASDEFPDTLAGVANQSRQFSAINGPRNVDYKVHGSLDKVPESVVPEGLPPLVEGWIDARAQGAPSSVGGNLHYANPHHSSPNNMVWINRLSGPRYGVGQSIHWHGTTDGFTPIEAAIAPLPPGEVPEGNDAQDAVAAISEATGLPFPSLDTLDAYFEQPGYTSQPQRVAPIPASYANRPRPVVARSLLDDTTPDTGFTFARQEGAAPRGRPPIDLLLSGEPNPTTSRMRDDGVVLNPWFSDRATELPQDNPRYAGDIDLGLTERNGLTPYIHESGPVARYVIDGATNYAPYAEPPNPYGSYMAGQDGGVWNAPSPDVPSRMVGEDRFTPRSLTADNSDPFDGFNALRPDPELAQSVADYAARQSNLETLLGSSNTSFAGQDTGSWLAPRNVESLLSNSNTSFARQEGLPARSLLGNSTAPRPATMSASLAGSRSAAPVPQMPSRSLTDSRRSSAPEPATPSAALSRSRNRPTPASQPTQMAAQRAIPFPAQQSASLLASRQTPQPATQSATLLASRKPQAPQPVLRQSMLRQLNETKLPPLAPPMEQGDGQPPAPSRASRFDGATSAAPFDAWGNMGQDAATATGLADFIAGQSAQAATASSFNDMMGVDDWARQSDYATPAEMEAATPFRFPDTVTAGNTPAIPDPALAQVDHSLDWYMPEIIEPDIWGSAPLPQMQTIVAPVSMPAVATELAIVPHAPFPAPRPAIAPIPADLVDPEWNPLQRLLGAVMETGEGSRDNRPAYNTILGTADNGGLVRQGRNGLLNSITQNSDWWEQATGTSGRSLLDDRTKRSTGSDRKGGGTARSLVGAR